MQLLRRLIAWACFAGLLTAVSVGVFHFVRYRPRCVIEAVQENLSVVHLSDDGKKLVVCRWPHEGLVPKKPEERLFQPRLEVIDSTSGRVVYTAENFATESDNGGFEIYRSPDRRHLAGIRTADTLLVDWQSGQSWPIEPPKNTTGFVPEVTDDGKRQVKEVQVAVSPGQYRCQFSPKGRWLTLAEEHVVEVATRRFVRRLPGLLGFLRDDGLAVFRQGVGQFGVWDLEHERLFMSITPGDALSNSQAVMLASDDGRWLILARANMIEGGMPGTRGIENDYVEVWDLNSKQRKLTWVVDRKQGYHMVLSRKGSRLALWSEKDEACAVSLIDLNADGDQLTLPLRQPLVIKHQPTNNLALMRWGRFSPTGTLFALGQYEHQLDQPTAIAVIDAAKRQVLWELGGYASLEFAGDGESVYCANFAASEKRDARTGAPQGPAVWPQGTPPVRDELTETTCHTMPVDACLTANGRFAASVRDEPQLPDGPVWQWIWEHLPEWCLPREVFLVVADTETKRELLRVGIDDCEHIRLSEDGGTLVSLASLTPGTTTVRIWEASPHRARFWAVAWSLAVGVGLLLLRHWRSKRKAGA